MGQRVCQGCEKALVMRESETIGEYRKRRYCGRACFNLWRRQNAKRYDYLYAQRGDRFGVEHRFIMEDILGRRLARNEHVHHINGDVRDNRPDNLVLVSPGEHMAHHKSVYPKHGTCAVCGVPFTMEITRRRYQRTCPSKDCQRRLTLLVRLGWLPTKEEIRENRLAFAASANLPSTRERTAPKKRALRAAPHTRAKGTHDA